MPPVSDDTVDVAIVGAGIAGLVCARELLAAGLRVLVLEKSRGVGGRCATRRMMGQPVDFGLAYYHSDDDDLLAALADVPATVLRGWPHRVAGSGPPCHPAAFRPGQQRLAYAEGVNAWPRQIARDVPLRLGARVTRIRTDGRGVVLDVEDGAPQRARDVVLTMPAPQSQAVLPSEEGRTLRAVHALLESVRSFPSVTLVAGYDPAAGDPGFDILYPEGSEILQLVAHDSAKRADPTYRVLVAQARAEWSRAHLERGPDVWRAALVDELARLCGAWARETAWSDVHRWRYAKVELSTEMSAPLVFGLPGGSRLGLASDAFTREAGVQGAFRAGRGLARRLLEDHANAG
ncbi:MAG: FAD-dependent oxidoreductase [Myxococcales bacterium]|nr:FAD-dependent oxidoreductase [Myxococcales bacterium]